MREPSIVTTNSLASARSGATKDWSVVSDEDEELVTPTASPPSIASLEDSFDGLGVSDDDGEGAWITPGNIKKHKIRDSTTTNPFVGGGVEKKVSSRRSSATMERAGPVMKSACMTGDYAMQNVALQMGLNLINMDGGGVRQVKMWILRCHGCFRYTPPPIQS